MDEDGHSETYEDHQDNVNHKGKAKKEVCKDIWAMEIKISIGVI